MKLLISTLVLFSMVNVMKASEQDFEFKNFKQAGSVLNYRLFKPKGFDESQTYSLVLTLHGSSLRGSDNKAQLKKNRGPMELKAYIQKNKLNAIVVAPQCPAGERWVETPWYGDSHTMPEEANPTMTLTIAMMKSLIENLPVDPKKVYVTGLSLGGFGCWDIIQRETSMFAAAMPICGGGDTAQAKKLKNLPIWIFHGDSDYVVKTKRSRDMFKALKEVDAKVQYTEYPNTGHDSFTATYNNPKVLKWLFSQVKK